MKLKLSIFKQCMNYYSTKILFNIEISSIDHNQNHFRCHNDHHLIHIALPVALFILFAYIYIVI